MYITLTQLPLTRIQLCGLILLEEKLGMGFPGGSVVKNLPAMLEPQEVMSLIPGSGKSRGGGHGNLLQYSCLENPMDWGAWKAEVQGVVQRFGHY